MAFLSGHLGRGASAQPGNADVVHRHLRVVFLAPLLGIFLIEPLIESRNEVYPLKNFQSLLGAGAVRARRQNQRRAKSSSKRPRCRGFNEIASGELFLCHNLASFFSAFSAKTSASPIQLTVTRRHPQRISLPGT